MGLLGKPKIEKIEGFLASQRLLDFSYPAVGGTRMQLPKGYDVDRQRVLLGRGEATFSIAREALTQWRMFPSRWTAIYPDRVEPREGVTLVMLAHCYGWWWLNSCRVVYTFDEAGPPRRVGFAYGTLPGHVERGEERFMVEWDSEDQVWYEIYSFSRPRHWLARMAYPLVRRLQARFVRDSTAQMKQLIATLAETADLVCETKGT